MDEETQMLLVSGFGIAVVFGFAMVSPAIWAIQQIVPGKIIDYIGISDTPIYLMKIDNQSYLLFAAGLKSHATIHTSFALPDLLLNQCYRLTFQTDALTRTVQLNYELVDGSFCQ